jgi:RsiW-degrading membrane proteinase PrsW (M82 family)
VVLGGLVGLVGAAFEEALHGVLLGPFVAAPIIEESLKPSGVYLLLAKWPQALPGRFYTALLSALAGLVFGLVENTIYLSIYFPEHSHELVVIRYTGGLALHTLASFIFGFGINQKLIAAAKGEIPMFAANKRFFITAMALHSAYNVAVTVFFPHVQ